MHDLIAYGDLTGKFPYKSTRGNQYILGGYNYDANNIRGALLKIEKQQRYVLHIVN